MSQLFKLFKTNLEAEANGQWVEIAPEVLFKLRSEQSIAVRERAGKIAKAQRALVTSHKGILPPALQDKNEIDLCATAIVVDWKGVKNEKGEDIPFSQDAVRALLAELPALRREIIYAARVDETFRTEAIEAIEGNSGKA